jgi:hypothetical protein
MLHVLLSNVLEKVTEHVVVIYYKLVYYRSVDVLTWELVLVALFYHLCHLCEVPRDSWSVVVDD